MAKVRFKMKCSNTGKDENGFHSVQMYPVSSKGGKNETFIYWTPSGELNLCILKSQYFEPGKEYYIDIEEAN